MAGLKVGDKFPEGVEFSYVPYSADTDSHTACGIPTTYKASEEFSQKRVILFSVPGAFTPGCHVKHLPGYIENIETIRGKGIDEVIVIASNDAFVMDGWRKANGVKDEIIFANDENSKFSAGIGWDKQMTPNRNARYAIVVDHGVVKYAEVEPGRDVTVSSALAVLAKL